MAFLMMIYTEKKTLVILIKISFQSTKLLSLYKTKHYVQLIICLFIIKLIYIFFKLSICYFFNINCWENKIIIVLTIDIYIKVKYFFLLCIYNSYYQSDSKLSKWKYYDYNKILSM